MSLELSNSRPAGISVKSYDFHFGGKQETTIMMYVPGGTVDLEYDLPQFLARAAQVLLTPDVKKVAPEGYIDLDGVEIEVTDYMLVIHYVMTNTNLIDPDPRMDFLSAIKHVEYGEFDRRKSLIHWILDLELEQGWGGVRQRLAIPRSKWSKYPK